MGLSFFRQLQKRNRDFEITVDGNPISVFVKENDRARRLIMRLAPGGAAVKVTVPSHVGDEEIETFVEKNRAWIATRIGRLPDRVKLAPGSNILFRGVEHRIEATGNLRGIVETAVNGSGQPVIRVPGEAEAIGKKLLVWLKREARKDLDQAVMRHCEKIAVRPKRLRITDTTSRWGSCSTTRTLSFSWRIIMAPPEILDYLAAHEVAHLVEMNHSARFWNLTRKLCPGTDTHKNWLRVNGSKLHAIDV